MNITQKKVTLYHAEWCGHCKVLKPTWDEFKQAYESHKSEIKHKYNTELIINDYESDSNPAMIPPYVNGYPTIMIEYNKKKEEYVGKRDLPSLFKKLIPTASDNDISKWSNTQLNARSNNSTRSNSNMQNTYKGPSYKKYLKYKMKYESYLNKLCKQ